MPDLPAAYARALESGLSALRVTLAQAARRAIDDHVRLLLAWTTAINLTSLRDPAEIATRHVVDSLSALPLLAGRADDLLDLGSGGGYPGLPLAAARPAARALLVESIGKKARVLSTAVEALGFGSRVDVAAERAETLARQADQRGRWPVVTGRAVGDLGELVELALPLLVVGGRLIAWKRGDIAAEVAAATQRLPRLGGGDVEVRPVHVPALPGHVLVVVTKRGPTPDDDPRDPRLRKHRPS
ncbi:MAG: 16S rRNA (guanine(527)-N(7))-methyltransferase RsmG [Chloroflexi bacterium]|nr:16S rRNA (guanine(527)-N(7))-methyltransferase RsmG [Chloroflexota bacterium]